LLEDDPSHTRKRRGGEAVGAVHRDLRVVVVERRRQAEGADRRPEPPPEVGQPLDEVRREPEVGRTELAVVLALAQAGAGGRLAGSKLNRWLPSSSSRVFGMGSSRRSGRVWGTW